MSFTIGENVGPYRIIEQLGQGGMATVYKAYHASLDRYVALKVLHPAFHQDQTFTMRFQREARVVARLEHQNIVPIYDYSEHEGRPFLVMKYIEGDTLKARMNLGPLTAEEIERVVNSVGYALAYAHRQGILHRDIKPSNVMISSDGTIYLADFGLARIAEAGESTMSSDSVMGTPQYISPEQAMGKKDLDAGTDIYSFGVMLYEMVVGRVPFTADTPFAIIHDHIYTPLPLPSSVNPNVPDSVQRVLLKALAKDRTDRYATVEELIKSFKDAWSEAGVPIQGTAIVMETNALKNSTPALVGETKQKKTSPWIWVAVGALVMLLCVISLLAIRNNRNARNNPSAQLLEATPRLVQPSTLPPQQPLPTLTGDVLELKSAQLGVKKNPNSPDAHLRLSLVLWEQGEKRTAFNEMNQAANLASPDVPDFFIMAADEYRKQEAWALAFGMYSRLSPIYRGKIMPEDLQTNLRESAYKSAEDSDLFDVKFIERMENVNLPLAAIVRGRQALLRGDLVLARMQLDKVKPMRPDMYEVILLEAEIAMKEGKQKQAKDLLTPLVEKAGVPAWVRMLAEQYLNTLQ